MSKKGFPPANPFTKKLKYVIMPFVEINVPKWLMKLAIANDEPLYLVGGYVRNALGGLPPSDIDIAGRKMPSELKLPHGFFLATTYKRMGTALIKCHYVPGGEVEYTPFRTEVYAEGGGHTPVSVSFDADISEDAKRRDFTVNSIYYDMTNDRIIDFFDGIGDLKRRVMRAYDPERVFSSDGLRLMRLVRIAAETGFGIDTETAEAAKRYAPLLKDITSNRKRDELIKILHADEAYGIEDAHYRGLTLLRDYGFLPYIVPELAGLDGLKQPSAYHKYDALEHTFRVVRYSPPEIRLAALFHDIGKAEAVKRTGKMHGHEIIGAEMIPGILGENGLKFPKKETDRVQRLVRWHMFDKDRRTRGGKMLLFVAHNSDIINELSALMDADAMGKGTGDAEPNRIKEFYNKLIESGGPLTVHDLRINGADMRELGYEGVEISRKLDELFSACVLDPSLNRHKKLMKLAQKDSAKV